MGVDKTGANLKVAMKENDVITYEEDYSSKYQGYTPGSPESFIIFSLMQFSHQSQSILLADMVQKQFNAKTNMRDRGVRQAGFLVLWSAAMPSILAEFGFISNSTEEKFIGSEKGRDTYARCLFNAFSEYKTRCEGHGTLIVLDDDKPEGNSVSESNDTQESQEELSAPSRSDSRPLTRGASGRILLAYQPPEFIQACIAARPASATSTSLLPAGSTPQTLTAKRLNLDRPASRMCR